MKNSWSQISSTRSNPSFLLLAVLIQMSRGCGMLHAQIYCSLGTKSRIDPKRSTWNEAYGLQIIITTSDLWPLVNLHVVCVLLMWQPFYFRAILTYGMLPYTMIPDYSQLFILRKFLKDLYAGEILCTLLIVCLPSMALVVYQYQPLLSADTWRTSLLCLFAIFLHIGSLSTPANTLCWHLEHPVCLCWDADNQVARLLPYPEEPE